MQKKQYKSSLGELRTIIKSIKVREREISFEIKDEMWKNIQASTICKTVQLRLFLRYAAVIALLAATSLYLYIHNYDNEIIDYESFISENIEVQKEAKNVVVILPDQNVIEVEDSNVELVLDAQGEMSINAKTVNNKSLSKHSSINYSQLWVPYGKTSSIVMSDGTKVWINSGSHVVYPTKFSEQKREIYVEGEVYLEVTRNPDCPFVVQTNKLEIEVLGTSFNVSAYKNDDSQSVVLATGSVSVRDVKKEISTTIKPNQRFTFENTTKETRIENVDVLGSISWKYGFLLFEKEKLDKVFRKIERYYNIPLKYDSKKMKDISLSGKLDLKENIEEILQIISITVPIEYEVRDNEIEINIKTTK